MSLGWTSDTVNTHVDVEGKTLEMKAHSEKFMSVSDMHVQDEDDRHDEQSRSKTIKANNKIVKERTWTLHSQQTAESCCINLVTSKILKQPLQSDTDAQLHKERVISVRKQAEIGFSSSTRENVPGEMRTSWQLFDVRSRRKLQRLQKCREKHR